MPRVKRGKTHVKRRRNILKAAKGFKWGRKKLIRQAKTAITKAGVYAYKDRRKKKRNFKNLWLIRINAALREKHDLNYSKFMHLLKQKNISLNKKMLAECALEHPAVFDKIVEKAKS